MLDTAALAVPRNTRKSEENTQNSLDFASRLPAVGARTSALADPPAHHGQMRHILGGYGPTTRHEAQAHDGPHFSKSAKEEKVLCLAPTRNVSKHVSWRPLPSLPPRGKLVFRLASACVTQGPIEHRNLKHEMSQLFSYWHVTVSRPVSFRFGQCGRGGAHCQVDRAQLVALVVCCGW